MSQHLLTLLVLVPFLGALAILFMPRQAPNALRTVSGAVMIVELLLSLRLVWQTSYIAPAGAAAVGALILWKMPKLWRLVGAVLLGAVATFGVVHLLAHLSLDISETARAGLLGATFVAATVASAVLVSVDSMRWLGGGALVLVAVPALLMTPTEDYGTAAYHFLVQKPWIEAFGISYKVGVDGISLWLVLLTTVLSPIALFNSWASIQTKIKEYAIAFLLLESAMIGTFVSLDLFMFYVFWELMLVPMYLIIGMWGGPRRVYAAVKFFLYTMVGSVLMLIAILYMVGTYKQLAGKYSFDLVELMRVGLPYEQQFWLFCAFALAFAIKVPMFPFHTWLPDAHVEAPTGGSVILAAVLLKMGTYGFLRFAMPLFPLAAHHVGPTIAGIAVVGIVYGAYCAWVQKDVKKLVAYSSVSHLGFVMLGLFALTESGVSGALLQMLNHGVSTGALFILVGVIYNRRHTRDLDQFGGLAKSMPLYTLAFVIIAMSSVGLPGTNGFIGEFLILAGTFTSTVSSYTKIHTIVAATGVILAAIYMLHAVLKMFWGPVTKEENKSLPDLDGRELTALVPLIVLVFFMGLVPGPFIRRMEPSVQAFLTDFREKRGFSQTLLEPQLFDREAPSGLPAEATAARVVLPTPGGQP